MRSRSSIGRPSRGAVRAACEAVEARTLLATLPSGFTESVVASGLTSGTAMEFSPDGKLFVAEQGGTLEVWQNGTRLRDNFFANTPLSLKTNSERGLLGIAFDPNYATNRFVYAYYTSNADDAHNRVSRFTANAAGDLALAGSEDVILELDAHSAGNHNGGAMHFGPDGDLYVAAGDNANGANSQSLTTRHGKMLRIDVTGDDFPADPNQDYRIPADQPASFGGITGTTTGLNRAIWAVGLRNPFTFAFQPGTGRLFIDDVGQNTWEEIDEGSAGRNYGWPGTEGAFDPSTNPGLTGPFYTYDHDGDEPNGVAITGGTFYNPTTQQFPASYTGDYFFADYGSGDIWALDLKTKAVTKFASDISAAVDLKSDASGNLYYLARGSGQVMRVAYGSQPPSITTQPQSQSATIGASVTFTATASGTGTLAYQWQRAESGTTAFANIGGATGASYKLAATQASDTGDRFRVVVTDSVGRSATSAFATLTTGANRPPTVAIDVFYGLRNGKFDAGRTIQFSGTATDPEQGKLSGSTFTWRVDYLTSINAGDADGDGLPGVTRPFVAPFSKASYGTFTPANTGPYTLADVAQVITLTATDAQGRTGTTRTIVYPNVVNVTLATNPTGLGITVDGQPSTAPKTFVGVVGFLRPIAVAKTQTLAGKTYTFASWSDGGALGHTIATPAVDTTYTAKFTTSTPPPPTTTGSFAAHVNFQPASSPGYAGYVADLGNVFGDRGNGLGFGWNADNRASAHDSNNSYAPDERYDTFNDLQVPGGATAWEIAVPSGTYDVHVVTGQVGGRDQMNNVSVEGKVINDATPLSHFDEYTVRVDVTDGRLTIRAAAGAKNVKLTYVDVTQVTPVLAPVGPVSSTPARLAAWAFIDAFSAADDVLGRV